MEEDTEAEVGLYVVVANDEEQYSIWRPDQ